MVIIKFVRNVGGGIPVGESRTRAVFIPFPRLRRLNRERAPLPLKILLIDYELEKSISKIRKLLNLHITRVANFHGVSLARAYRPSRFATFPD